MCFVFRGFHNSYGFLAELADALDLGSSVARRKSSSLLGATICLLAQMEEQCLSKARVESSSLSRGTTQTPHLNPIDGYFD